MCRPDSLLRYPCPTASGLSFSHSPARATVGRGLSLSELDKLPFCLSILRSPSELRSRLAPTSTLPRLVTRNPVPPVRRSLLFDRQERARVPVRAEDRFRRAAQVFVGDALQRLLELGRVDPQLLAPAERERDAVGVPRQLRFGHVGGAEEQRERLPRRRRFVLAQF